MQKPPPGTGRFGNPTAEDIDVELASSDVQDGVIPAEVKAPYVSDEDRQLADAKAAADAEQAALAGAAPAVPVVATDTTVAEEKDDSKTKAPAMVPLAALKSEREARQLAELENARLQGAVQVALMMANKPEAGAQPQAEITPEQRLEQLREERLSLADKFDAGEMSARAMEEQRLELEAEEREIRESVRPKAAAPVQQQDLRLEEQTSQLEKDYPILNELAAEDLTPLVSIAYRDAAREGKPIQPGAAGTLALRTRVAQLATKLHGTPQQQTPVKPNQPGTTTAAPVSLPASNKADLAANHPVDASSLGSGGSGGPLSEAEIATKLSGMNEDEQIAFLATPGLVQRVMGRLGT